MTVLLPRRLQVPAAFTAPPLDELTGLQVIPGRTEDRRSALYDTADLDLTRWGVRIEHDTRQGWRIELPEVATIERHVRVLDGGASVPAQVRRTVRALTGDRPLRRLVRLDVRAVITLLVEAGQDEPVLLLADEEVSVTEGRRLVARFREQVIRPGTGATPARLDAVEARLCEAGAVALGAGSSRLLDVLGPRASSPPAVLDGDRGAVGGGVAEEAVAHLRRTLQAVPLLDAHVRLHGQPQAVAMYASELRHLRALLGAWDDPTEDEARESVRCAVGGLLQAADDVVLVDARRGRIIGAAALAGFEPARRQPLDDRIERDRTESYETLLRRLDRPDVRQALDAVRSLRPGPVPADGPPLATATARAAERRWGRLCEAVGTAAMAPATEQIGQLLEELAVLGDVAADAVDDGSAQRFRKRLRRHRRALVRSARSHETITWLQRTSMANLDPETCFDAGQLAGIERLAATRADALLASTWAKLGKPKSTRWLRAVEGPGGSTDR